MSETRVVANNTTKVACGLTVRDGHEYTVWSHGRDEVHLCDSRSSFSVTWKEFEANFDKTPTN